LTPPSPKKWAWNISFALNFAKNLNFIFIMDNISFKDILVEKTIFKKQIQASSSEEKGLCSHRFS